MDGFKGQAVIEDRTATFIYAAAQPRHVICVCVCLCLGAQILA